MPLTLLQKNIAGRIIRLFKRYHISPQAVILEITEEQAFSNAESSMYNIDSCISLVSGLRLMTLAPDMPTTNG